MTRNASLSKAKSEPPIGAPESEEEEERETTMSNNTKTAALAFLVGAATGGIAALLLAPGSGKDLRNRIGENAEKAREEVTRIASVTRGAAVEGYREAVRRTEKAVDDNRVRAKAGKKAVVDAVAEGKASYARETGQAT